MSITKKAIVGVMSAAALFAALAARAQDSAAAPPPLSAPQDGPYQPSLADIMAHQQERHIKLWFAGHAGNWVLADYEIGELSDGFDDVGKMLGGDIVQQRVGAALEALQKAVDGKNSAAFIAAFDNLSAGCNGCHRTLDHAFIAIARPTVPPYSDQVFSDQVFAPRKQLRPRHRVAESPPDTGELTWTRHIWRLYPAEDERKNTGGQP